jgi:hypothetical protein
LCYTKVDFQNSFLHNKKILRTAGGLWIANSTALLLKNKAQKKSPANCGAFYIQKISRNYFFSDFSILAFNAANISLLSPKVAAGAFVDELDEVFSVAVFTFFSSSSRKIAV